MNTEIFIRPDGTIQVIGDAPQELAALGEGTRRRASSILPVAWGKRCAFLFLRALFGERGRVAEWTRQWVGPWTGRLFATGETFTAQSRRVVLKWEHERLNKILEGQ